MLQFTQRRYSDYAAATIDGRPIPSTASFVEVPGLDFVETIKHNRERAEDLEAQVKERDVLVEELVLSNQAQMERNETLTVQNEDLRGDFNEAVRGLDSVSILDRVNDVCSRRT